MVKKIHKKRCRTLEKWNAMSIPEKIVSAVVFVVLMGVTYTGIILFLSLLVRSLGLA